MWGDSKFSREAQRDVHRTRPTNVTAPALTWHTAFYLPHGVRQVRGLNRLFSNETSCPELCIYQDQNPDQKKDRVFTKNELDKFFVALYSGLWQQQESDRVAITPRDGNKIFLFNKILETDANGRYLEGKNTNLNDQENQICKDIHGEYPVVRAKFPWGSLSIELRCELSREYFTFTLYVTNIEACPYHRKEIDRLRRFAINNGNIEDKKKISEMYYVMFWKNLEEYIKAHCSDMKNIENSIVFSNIFADLRGVTLTIFREDAHKTRPENFQYIDWSRISQHMIDFVTSKDEYECTASHFLGRKILYMSDLGQRRTGGIEERIPVTFLVCVKGVDHGEGQTSQFFVNKWQLGRLIERLNSLGTLRLAALRDLSLVAEASRSLAAFEPIMKEAQKDLALKTVDDARSFFRSIASKFLDDDSTKQGLQYRIERSRYYVSRFFINIKHLRIERIEGYQSYDQFVERRIGSQLDFIDRVGVRYERASSSLSLLDQNYLAKNLENIQEWADLALIGFLIPYYSYSLVYYLIPEAINNLRGFAVLAWVIAIGFACYRFFGLGKSFSKDRLLKCIIMIGTFLLFLGAALNVTGDLQKIGSKPIDWFNPYKQQNTDQEKEALPNEDKNKLNKP